MSRNDGYNRGGGGYYNDNRGSGNSHYNQRDDRGSGNRNQHDNRGSQGYQNSQQSNSQQGYSRGDRDNRGQWNDGSRYRDDVSSRMSNMSIGSREGSDRGSYSQSSSGGSRGRGFGSSNSDSRGSATGGKGLAPVAKKDLPYQKIEFASRPNVMVQDKPRIGKKLDVITNHALVRLPTETIKLRVYNIEVRKNKKVLNKREEASPVFWEIFRENQRSFGMTPTDIVFNDVNTLWCVKEMPEAHGMFSLSTRGSGRSPRSEIEYKYTGMVELGANISQDQEDSVMTTLLDAIMTSRARNPRERNYCAFKRMLFLVNADLDESITDDFSCGQYVKWGLDARLGFSFAVKTNLRAGITTCFDIGHTLFTKPCYPLIRLLIEVIEGEVISDEDYEAVWDSRLQGVRPDRKNLELMAGILKKMSLTFCVDTALGMDYAKKKSVEPVLPARGGVQRNPRNPRDFKFYQLCGSADEETFELQEHDSPGQVITVAEYFLSQYQITLRYPNLPCLLKKPKKGSNMKVMYPMELCSFIVNPARYEGFSPEGLRSQLIRETTYSPSQRRQLLQHVISQARVGSAEPVIDNEDPHMKAHNVAIGSDLLKSKASLLPSPTVVYGNGTVKDPENSGEWEAIRHVPVRTVLESSLVERAGGRTKVVVGSIIIVHHPLNPDSIVNYDFQNYIRLMNALETAGQPVYKKGGMPTVLDIREYRSTESPAALLEYIKEAKHHIDTAEEYRHEDFVPVPLFFLLFEQRCSLFENTPNDYNLLKLFCDNTVGVYTQGILLRHFNTISENSSTCRLTCHLVEKILGKIGTTHRELLREPNHRPWFVLTDPEAPTLVLGIDVSHPKAADRVQDPKERDGDKRKVNGVHLSVASIVGNIDTNISQFRASSRIQDSGEEQIVRMEDQLCTRFADFITNTKKRPAHIVVYRDGLSEGDFKRIMYEELLSIKNACEKIAEDFKPTVTYILVSKRHHTKLFPVDPESPEDNVKPGTLVEDVVTSTKYYDFFLASQVGQMGTSKPTHYYVLHDEWAPMDSFWPMVTNDLTYNFCRTTTTIALPSPVMYAHLAAKRAKETFDAANFFDYNQGIRCDLESGTGHQKRTEQIQMNGNLDGMVFV